MINLAKRLNAVGVPIEIIPDTEFGVVLYAGTFPTRYVLLARADDGVIGALASRGGKSIWAADTPPEDAAIANLLERVFWFVIASDEQG